MAIQVHFVNPNPEQETEKVVADFLTVLALKKLYTLVS